MNSLAVRLIPVGVLRIAALALHALSLLVCVAFVLIADNLGHGDSARVVYATLLTAIFVIQMFAVPMWGLASGRITAPTGRSVRYHLACSSVFAVLLFVYFLDTVNWSPGRGILIASLAVALGAMAFVQRRGRTGIQDTIGVPMATRTIIAPDGSREIRVSEPRVASQNQWVVWWSVAGGHVGHVVQPAYGADAVAALQNALQQATSLAAVGPGPHVNRVADNYET